MTREELPAARPGSPGTRSGLRPDLLAVAAAALLFAAAAVVGTLIENNWGTLHVSWAPLYAKWRPHVGPGTPAALAVAGLVVAHGPALARRLAWRRLLPVVWLASMAWTWSLALVDGWHRGVAERLTTKYEYLQVIDRFEDIGGALRGFTQHILIDSPDHWPAHVAGHPPAAVLTFVGLDRVGLGGGAWAAAFCVTVGTSAAVAVLVALRALTDARTARRAAPFLVLWPGAVWAGVSADGYFTAVAAWSVALLALAATARDRRRSLAHGFCSGLLLGLTCYLSYGLTLFLGFALAVLLLTRTARPVPPLLAGLLVVPLAFTLAGFHWWEAYDLLVDRYFQGAGGIRPYWYWIWANPACTVLLIGAATAAGLGRLLPAVPRALRGLRTGRLTPADRLTGLVLTALLAVLAADLSGMSKAETERIWLPFALWLLPATALLPTPTHRHWLAAQAGLALAVNHLLFTGW